MLVSPDRLTYGERLFLNRRRSGLTQAAEAKRRGVSLYRYAKWELDADTGGSTKIPLINRLFPHEECIVHRRRCGMTAEQVASKMGCCTFWVRRMEKGQVPHSRLYAFWSSRHDPR